MVTQTAPSLPPNSNISQTIVTKPPVDETSRRWQLSGLDVVEEIGHRLKGEIYDFDKNRWIPVPNQKPLITDEGITEIRAWLSSYINKNNLLSYYEPSEIRVMLIDLEQSLTLKLEYDWKELGIKKQDIDIVWLTICNMAWAAINRALRGGEKRFLENTEQRSITTTENQAQKKGMLENIPIIGRMTN